VFRKDKTEVGDPEAMRKVGRYEEEKKDDTILMKSLKMITRSKTRHENLIFHIVLRPHLPILSSAFIFSLQKKGPHPVYLSPHRPILFAPSSLQGFYLSSSSLPLSLSLSLSVKSTEAKVFLSVLPAVQTFIPQLPFKTAPPPSASHPSSLPDISPYNVSSRKMFFRHNLCIDSETPFREPRKDGLRRRKLWKYSVGNLIIAFSPARNLSSSLFFFRSLKLLPPFFWLGFDAVASSSSCLHSSVFLFDVISLLSSIFSPCGRVGVS
jgi:hypothetical protein